MGKFDDIFLEKIDSTNAWAKKNFSTFDPKKITCVTAEEQTHGLGRFQRTWISPKGNLYSTFYFQLGSNALHLTCLAQIMCLTLAEVLIQENLEPLIKWPNDVLLSGKKVSGVLCETSFEKEKVHVFLGIGVNVNMKEDSLSQIDQKATSLFCETKKEWDIKKLLKSLQKKFASNLELFEKEGFAPFHSCFENLLAYKEEKISCFDGITTYTGILHSVTSDGRLNLYLDSKEMKTFSCGDVSLRT